jgi:integrase
MGHRQPGVRVRSASSIEIDFYFRGTRCRERLRLQPTPNNLRYAAKFKARIEHEIGRGEFDYKKHFPDSPRARLFSQLAGDSLQMKSYLPSWLRDEKDNIKHSTWLGYDKILRYHLIPEFGETTLADFRRKDVHDWIANRPALSAKRLRNIVSVLRVALDAAVERDLIESNPLITFRVRRRSAASREDIDPFSAQERAAILSELRGQDRNFVEFAFWTGLRTSELVALDWSDIDWTRGVARISRVLTLGMNKPESGAKTAAGIREVKLLRPAVRALQAQKAHTFFRNAEVFQNPRTGKRWTGDKCIRQGMWTPALRKARVRYRRPYTTRHTYASMLLAAGESPMWVATQMGHTDWSLTAKRYARWIPSDMPDAGSRAEALWSQDGHSGIASHSNENGEGGIRTPGTVTRATA